MTMDRTIGGKVSSRKLLKFTYIFGLVLMLLLSVSLPILTAFAEDDRGESKIKAGYGTYAGDLENTYEVYGKLADDIPQGRENSFRYIMKRVLVPGYMNDVSSGVLSKNADGGVINGGSVCDPNAPNNLISSNCDIPNFSAQLVQSVMRILDPGGIEDGERVSAQSFFKWGVPDNIPGGTVPITPNQRKHKYTGLELFGYNMNYTNYNGEWDDIIPSTRARMLANFGFMDKLNMTGTSIWNGVTTGMSSFIDGLSWNPTTWLGNVERTFESSVSSSFLTIIDTSDMNVAATRGWVRSGRSVGGSFYNVKVLTDKEVMDESSISIGHLFRSKLVSSVESDEHLKYVMSMETPPTFTYDPNLESEESKAARKKANDKNVSIDKDNEAIRKYNAEVDAHNKEVEESGKGKLKDKKDLKDKVKVPAKEFVPEEVQFADWKKSDPRVAEGEGIGITCEVTKNISEFQSCWAEKYSTYQKAEFNVSSATVSKLIKDVKESLFENNPHSDPTQAISHYVCTDSNGNAMRDDTGKYVYLYTKENQGNKEFVNPKCSIVRPTIQGGYLGDGYGTGKTTDTRHISNIESNGFLSMLPIVGNINKSIQDFFMNVSRFIAQLINEMLNLAFSPLMDKLGISDIVAITIESLKNTVFFPLVVVVVAASALAMFWNAIRSGSLINFFISFGTMFLIFMIGTFLLQNPKKMVNFVDSGSAKAEQFIASAILNQDSGDGLCATSVTDSNAGIRSAQCHVWSSLVYQPWVFGQWGTSHNNVDASKFNNTNQNLVGDASVNMGGGVEINNWAAYQLDLMTSGTLTTQDKKNPVGQLDNRLYQLVDLQAGLNGGEGTDSRYFSSWTGKDSSRGVISVESAILSIFMLIVMGGLLISKIELTFIFSIMLLGLPFMLLMGLMPKGRLKLLGYVSTLGSLFLRRMVSTVLISLMLLMINIVTSDNANSYNIVFIGGMITLGFFKVYKKEIFAIFKLDSQSLLSGEGIMSGDPDAIKSFVSRSTPLAVKNKLYMAKHKISGGAAGAIGGAIGGGGFVMSQNLNKNREIYRANKENEKFARKYGNVYRKQEKEKYIVPTAKEAFKSVRDATADGAHRGLHSGSDRQAVRAQLHLSRRGLDVFSINSSVKRKVIAEGSSRIVDKGEIIASSVHYEAELARLYRDERKVDLSPSYQKKVREIADEISSKVSTLENNSLYSIGVEYRDRIEDLSHERDKSLDKEIDSIKNRRPFNPHRIEDKVKMNTCVTVSQDVKETIERGGKFVGKRNQVQPTAKNDEEFDNVTDSNELTSLKSSDDYRNVNIERPSERDWSEDSILKDPVDILNNLEVRDNGEELLKDDFSPKERVSITMPEIEPLITPDLDFEQVRSVEDEAVGEEDKAKSVLNTRHIEEIDPSGVVSYKRKSTIVDPSAYVEAIKESDEMIDRLTNLANDFDEDDKLAREDMKSESPSSRKDPILSKLQEKNNNKLGGDIYDNEKD